MNCYLSSIRSLAKALQTSTFLGTLFLASSLSSLASSITLLSGEVVEGEILVANHESLIVALKDGGAKTLATDELQPESLELLRAWKDRNPRLASVHTRFDRPPVPRRTVEPARERVPAGASGMVSIGLVIDEAGRVITAEVLRSQHAGLETEAINAVRRWIFDPAEVGNSPVTSYIVVPLRFN